MLQKPGQRITIREEAGYYKWDTINSLDPKSAVLGFERRCKRRNSTNSTAEALWNYHIFFSHTERRGKKPQKEKKKEVVFIGWVCLFDQSQGILRVAR